MFAGRIGLLDFGDLPVASVVDLATTAERFGFSRFWLAEHLEASTYSNSLLMSTVVAGMTSTIRVGPAGVLLRYYAGAAVARDALFLEHTFGRIDLGLSAGRIVGPARARFEDGRPEATPSEFRRRIEDVADWLVQRSTPALRPALWLLGASENPDTAELASRLFGHFSLSLFHTATPPSPGPIHAYRDACHRRGGEAGTAIVALAMACLESERDRAKYANAHPGVAGTSFVDVPARCRERLEEVLVTYGADEVVVLETNSGVERRTASLQMLAEACGGLPGPSTAHSAAD